jgi:3-dehydroquinate synthase
MKSIRVSLKERSYNITFGRLEKDLAGLLPRGRYFIVTSQAVQDAGHAGRLLKALRKKCQASLVVLPNGEAHKNLATLERLYKAGVKHRLDRKTTIVGLGGGVTTDLAGFFAATYMRGLPFVAVPTTLLGMVDAAIGGKTGVDLPQGKNLVGAFWQPRLVWIDTSLLKSLPPREWVTGFAEIIKYGVIKSRPFFEWLEGKLRKKHRVQNWDQKDLMEAIYRSAAIKADVVGHDERETPLQGGREILNFGHTIGHALEAATGYRSLSHGEAISIGMVAAGRISLSMRMWSNDNQLRLMSLLDSVGLPLHRPTLSSSQMKRFWGALMKDKKNVAGSLRFVLPRKIGAVEVKSGVPLHIVKKVLFYGRS